MASCPLTIHGIRIRIGTGFGTHTIGLRFQCMDTEMPLFLSGQILTFLEMVWFFSTSTPMALFSN